MPLAILTLALALAEPDPTKPGLVALDFRDRPVNVVVEELGRRSGNPVHANLRDRGNQAPPRLSLVAEEPVPFWDAIDRLCREAKLQHYLVDGSFNGQRTRLSINEGDGGEQPAQYAGPFRLARLSLHADFTHTFTTGQASTSRHAEFQVLAEPRILAIRNGPIRVAEALDDRGHPLADPADPDPEKRSPDQAPPRFMLGRSEGTMRVKLGEPSAGATRLKVLRGSIPVRLAEIPAEPALTIPLDAPVGKVWAAGFVRVTVEEVSAKPDGSTKLKFSVRVDGANEAGGPPPADPSAAAWSVAAQNLVDVVDARGLPVKPWQGGMSVGGEMEVDYLFANRDDKGAATKPTQIRVFLPRWVDWSVPFEFRDLPLP